VNRAWVETIWIIGIFGGILFIAIKDSGGCAVHCGPYGAGIEVGRPLDGPDAGVDGEAP